MKTFAVILASGTGERTGLNIPKQFALIGNKSILEITLETFNSNNKIDEIILVSNPLFIDKVQNILNKNNFDKVSKLIKGGQTRQQSSYNGVFAIDDNIGKVLIHDAVRPFVSNEIIDKCILSLDKYKAVNVAIESSDTIVEIDNNNIIKSVPDRKYLRRCQTPQCFDLSLIKKAHTLAKEENIDNISDDCGLILRYHLADIYVINGSSDNIKITYPIDLKIAELILNKQKKESN